MCMLLLVTIVMYFKSLCTLLIANCISSSMADNWVYTSMTQTLDLTDSSSHSFVETGDNGAPNKFVLNTYFGMRPTGTTLRVNTIVITKEDNGDLNLFNYSSEGKVSKNTPVIQ